ncbi:MAG: type restriction enzyme subunit [Chthoniobacter sp.]|jgi:type I restriction enzyme S subunit|nr:type restriction enzyme subunit [Chthoniobacter sp.]
MSASWQNTTIGEAVDLLTGFPFRSAEYSEDQTQPRLVRGDNVIQGKLRWQDAKHWPLDKTGPVRDYALTEGDVVVAMDRPWIEAGLKFARITKHDLPCYLVQRVARLRARKNLDQRFLGFVVASSDFTEHVLAVQTGTSIPHISAGQIKEFGFALPPIAEQRAIARVLGTLDDRIAQNQRMNRTLDELAAALFQSCFVDFDPVVEKAAGRAPFALASAVAALFPAAFADSELGPVPRGWRTGKVSELASMSRGGINPGDFPAEAFDHYSIPAFDDGRQPQPELGSTIKSNKFPVPADCVLVSKLNPRIPRVWMPELSGERRAICSTEFLVMTPKSPITREFLCCLFSSDAFTSDFATFVTGTSGSHQRVMPESLLGMDAVIPPAPLVERFTKIVRPWLAQAAHNIRESHTLAALRDTLLPKLLSGEVRVKLAERVLEGP